jgi:hypothetical protein
VIPRIRLRRTGGAISRNGPGVRRNRQARPVRCTGQVASGLHERAAHIYFTDRLCFVISGTWW